MPPRFLALEADSPLHPAPGRIAYNTSTCDHAPHGVRVNALASDETPFLPGSVVEIIGA